MFNAKPLQVGFVLLQSYYGFVSLHKICVANWTFASTAFDVVAADASARCLSLQTAAKNRFITRSRRGPEKRPGPKPRS
jgi:hypothetical protein